jgi:hypothetical protein
VGGSGWTTALSTPPRTAPSSVLGRLLVSARAGARITLGKSAPAPISAPAAMSQRRKGLAGEPGSSESGGRGCVM